jgi:hypothetical protein
MVAGCRGQFYVTLPPIFQHVCRSRLLWIAGSMIVGAPLFRILLSHWVTNGGIAGYALMPCRADALGWANGVDSSVSGRGLGQSTKIFCEL